MKSVGLRELNQRFSRYIKVVKAGEELLITERGQPVAIIKPIVRTANLATKIRQLEAQGLLTPPRLKGSPKPHLPVPLPGQGLAETVSVMRDER